MERTDSPEEAQRVGVRLGADIAREVVEGGSPGVHIYTFNQAGPALSLLEAIERGEARYDAPEQTETPTQPEPHPKGVL